MTRMAGDQIQRTMQSGDPEGDSIKQALAILSDPNATEEQQTMAMIRLSELQNLVGRS